MLLNVIQQKQKSYYYYINCNNQTKYCAHFHSSPWIQLTFFLQLLAKNLPFCTTLMFTTSPFVQVPSVQLFKYLTLFLQLPYWNNSFLQAPSLHPTSLQNPTLLPLFYNPILTNLKCTYSQIYNPCSTIPCIQPFCNFFLFYFLVMIYKDKSTVYIKSVVKLVWKRIPWAINMLPHGTV